MRRGARPKAAPAVTPTERVVGEEQWDEAGGRGLTLDEFLGVSSIWLTVGLCLLTLLVRLPALRIVQSARGGPTPMVMFVASLALFAVAWPALSHWLAHVWLRRRSTAMQAALGVLAAGSLWLWVAAAPKTHETFFVDIGGRLAFGPFPTDERMEALEARGFEGLVSLLDPEAGEEAARLHAEGRRLAEAFGMEFLSTPMIEGGTLNERSLETMEAVLRKKGGPYYVHSGASGAGTEAARLLLSRMAGRRAMLPDRLGDVEAFERGPVYHLGEGVVLAPFPTEEEMFEYYLLGSVASVLSLTDPGNPSDARWLEEERGLLSRYGIPLRHAPVRPEPFDPEDATAAVELARSLPRPLVVQSFLTPSTSAEAFLQAYLSGHPPLPPSLFRQPLSGGETRVVAPNVAVGPRPVTREFGALFNRGVRVIARLDASRGAGALEDRRLSGVAGIEWFEHGGSAELMEALATGGPWYVYGTGSEAFARAVEERYGPAMPEPDGAAEGDRPRPPVPDSDPE